MSLHGKTTTSTSAEARDIENTLPGGIYNATPPTLPDGGSAPLQQDSRGNVKVTLSSGANAVDPETAGADAGSNTSNRLPVSSRNYGFNGTTWDRLRTAVTTISSVLTGFLNTLPWAIYNSTPTTRTNGQGGPLQADTLGNLNTNAGTLSKGEDENRNLVHVSNGGDGTRITTAATTVCRNSVGRLNGAYVEVALTGTATFYDNASSAAGTVLGILPIGTPQGWHEFKGESAANGVVCVTSAADRLVVNTGR